MNGWRSITLTLCRMLLTALMLWSATARSNSAQSAEFTLVNGLRVVIRERHDAPLVAIDLWVRAGSREEAPGETGAAHFLEHTLFKGTRTRLAGEADRTIENLGATLSAATGPDYARFYTCVGVEHAGDALNVLADVVRNATLPAEEIERERKVILTELAQRDSDSTSLLIERLYRTVYADHPYGRPPGGSQTDIRDRTRDTLAAFYRRTYAPARCTLVIVGDLTEARARGIAERSFGDWAGETSTTAMPIDNSRKPARNGVDGSAAGDNGGSRAGAVDKPTVVNAAIVRPVAGIAFRAPAASDVANACAAQLVAAMLGQSDLGGRLATARLSGCEARASFAPRRDPGLFLVSSAAQAVSAGHIRTRDEASAAAFAQNQSMLAVLDGLAATPPTAGELAGAKSALLGRAIFENETNAGLASSVGASAITGGPPPEAWRAAIEGTTLQDVRRFITRWLDPANRLDLVLLPGPPARPPDSRP